MSEGLGTGQDAGLRDHLKQVATAMARGNVAPLLGAGVNMTVRPPRQPWRGEGRIEFLPNGTELAEYLVDEFQQEAAPRCETAGCLVKDRLPRPDLIRVSQAIQVQQGEVPLLESLSSIFQEEHFPLTETHRFLARIPKLLAGEKPAARHQLIMTTNYDDLMERAFQEEGQEFDLIWYQAGGRDRTRFFHKKPDGTVVKLDEQPNDYGYPFFEERPVILKLHGTAEDETGDGSYVITEDHYIDYLSRVDHRSLPKSIVRRWINLLYLGYSLRDYNLRVMVKRLQQSDGRERVSWTVLYWAAAEDVEYWAKNQVKVIQADLKDYIPRLEEALTQVARRPEEGA